jgi:hypothetical protein
VIGNDTAVVLLLLEVAFQGILERAQVEDDYLIVEVVLTARENQGLFLMTPKYFLGRVGRLGGTRILIA